jgi:hypothetical protein
MHLRASDSARHQLPVLIALAIVAAIRSSVMAAPIVPVAGMIVLGLAGTLPEVAFIRLRAHGGNPGLATWKPARHRKDSPSCWCSLPSPRGAPQPAPLTILSTVILLLTIAIVGHLLPPSNAYRICEPHRASARDCVALSGCGPGRRCFVSGRKRLCGGRLSSVTCTTRSGRGRGRW